MVMFNANNRMLSLVSTTSAFFEELPGGFDPRRLNGDFRTFTVDGASFKDPLSVPGWCISNGADAEKTTAHLGLRSQTHPFTRTILESPIAEVTDLRYPSMAEPL